MIKKITNSIRKIENCIYVAVLRLFVRNTKSHFTIQSPILIISDTTRTGGTYTFLSNLVDNFEHYPYSLAVYPINKLSAAPIDFLQNNKVQFYRNKAKTKLGFFLDIAGIVNHSRPGLVIISSGALDHVLPVLSLNVPTLFFLHTLPHKPLPKYLEFMLRTHLTEQKRLVGVSEASQKAIHSYIPGLPTDRVTFLYNYVRNKPSPVPKTLQHPITILTIGHLLSYKNPFLWIDVATKLLTQHPHIPLQFLWLGEGELFEECKHRSAALSPAIQFLGFCSDVHPYLEKATFYFQPSSTESFGLSVAEAMMHGVPTVVSNAGALPELVEHNVSGLVFDLDNPEAASQALEHCITMDPTEYRNLSLQARQRYEQMFTQDRWMQSFKNLTKEIGVNI